LGQVEGDPSIEIFPQKLAYSNRVIGWQQIGADIFSSDCVGFRLFEIFALIVTRDSHREAKANNEGEQRKSGGLNDIEVFPLILVERLSFPAKQTAGIDRRPLHGERDNKSGNWSIETAHCEVDSTYTVLIFSIEVSQICCVGANPHQDQAAPHGTLGHQNGLILNFSPPGRQLNDGSFFPLPRPALLGGIEAGLKLRTVVLEFDSVRQARDAHDSPAYQEALRLLARELNATFASSKAPDATSCDRFSLTGGETLPAAFRSEVDAKAWIKRGVVRSLFVPAQETPRVLRKWHSQP
jgi:hypothetical protein